MYDFVKLFRNTFSQNSENTETPKPTRVEATKPKKTARLPSDKSIYATINEQSQQIWRRKKPTDSEKCLICEKKNRIGSLRIIDPHTGDCMSKISGPNCSISCALLIPHRNELLAAGFNHSLTQWDLSTDTCLHSYELLDNEVNCMLAISNTSHVVLSLYTEIKVVDVDLGQFLRTISLNGVQSIFLVPNTSTHSSVNVTNI